MPKAHPRFPLLHDNIFPNLFSLEEKLNAIDRHYRRQRRHSPSNCCNDRYVLFMLDTSGSIGRNTWHNMVNNLSMLVPTFCDNTKVAVMTFSSEVHIEFCFNCFDTSNMTHLYSMKNAISSLPYRSGYTSTGSAIKCVCENILTTSCGLPSEEEYRECPAPIDVIVITDGLSNGHIDVCEAAKCLHNQAFYDINVFAIGVNNFDQVELDCIVNQHDLNEHSIFYMSSYKEVDDLIKEIIVLLISTDPSDYMSCIDLNTRVLHN